MDRLINTATPETLVRLLREAQAERDQLLHETLRLESQLTVATIAIYTAQQENRAPIYPPPVS